MDTEESSKIRRTDNRPSRPASYDRWAAQAIAITQGLSLVRDRCRPDHAPTFPGDTDIEALAVGIGVLRPAAGSSSSATGQESGSATTATAQMVLFAEESKMTTEEPLDLVRNVNAIQHPRE